MKKRLSMRSKLLLIFGILIALATIIEGMLVVQTSCTEVEEARKDKALTTLIAFEKNFGISCFRCRFFSLQIG